MQTYFHYRTNKRTFKAALLIIGKPCAPTKCPPTREETNKPWNKLGAIYN